MIHCPAIPLEEHTMALARPPAGKSYQEAPADADAALLDAFRHVEGASLTR